MDITIVCSCVQCPCVACQGNSVHPNEIPRKFAFSSITLLHPSLSIQVKTTAPKRYCVKPSAVGFLTPVPLPRVHAHLKVLFKSTCGIVHVLESDRTVWFKRRPLRRHSRPLDHSSRGRNVSLSPRWDGALSIFTYVSPIVVVINCIRDPRGVQRCCSLLMVLCGHSSSRCGNGLDVLIMLGNPWTMIFPRRVCVHFMLGAHVASLRSL